MQYQNKDESVVGDLNGTPLEHLESQNQSIANEQEGTSSDHSRVQIDPARGAPLQNDPWSALLQSQGIEVVDLQQVRARTAQPAVGNLDVEQALDIMQEQPGNDTGMP